MPKDKFQPRYFTCCVSFHPCPLSDVMSYKSLYAFMSTRSRGTRLPSHWNGPLVRFLVGYPPNTERVAPGGGWSHHRPVCLFSYAVVMARERLEMPLTQFAHTYETASASLCHELESGLSSTSHDNFDCTRICCGLHFVLNSSVPHWQQQSHQAISHDSLTSND